MTYKDIITSAPALAAVLDRARARSGRAYRERLAAYTQAKWEAERELPTPQIWEAFTRALSDILDI